MRPRRQHGILPVLSERDRRAGDSPEPTAKENLVLVGSTEHGAEYRTGRGADRSILHHLAGARTALLLKVCRDDVRLVRKRPRSECEAVEVENQRCGLRRITCRR